MCRPVFQKFYSIIIIINIVYYYHFVCQGKDSGNDQSACNVWGSLENECLTGGSYGWNTTISSQILSSELSPCFHKKDVIILSTPYSSPLLKMKNVWDPAW
jgi:hypothetical protein